MQLDEIAIIKQDERGTIYDCGKSSFLTRKKGTISADHSHPDPETIYLVSGEIELTIGKETKRVQAPIMFTIGSNIYHKLIALTYIALVLDRDNK